jgi:hypothetical protein
MLRGARSPAGALSRKDFFEFFTVHAAPLFLFALFCFSLGTIPADVPSPEKIHSKRPADQEGRKNE